MLKVPAIEWIKSSSSIPLRDSIESGGTDSTLPAGLLMTFVAENAVTSGETAAGISTLRMNVLPHDLSQEKAEVVD